MDQKWLLLWIVLSSLCVTGYSLQILDLCWILQFDRTAEKTSDQVESGAIGAASPKEAAAKSDVLPR